MKKFTNIIGQLGKLKIARGHFSNLLYVTGGTVLQVGALNFIVFPFLSRTLQDQFFGEILLLLTIINFYISVIAPPIGMSFYRLHSSLPSGKFPKLTASVLKLTSFLLIIFIILNLYFYDYINAYWSLTVSKVNFFYLLVYLFFMVIDSTLLPIFYMYLDFPKAFLTRALFFLGTILVIPAAIYCPSHWIAALIIGPMLGSGSACYLLGHENRLSFQKIRFRESLSLVGKSFYGFFLPVWVPNYWCTWIDGLLLRSISPSRKSLILLSPCRLAA